MYQSNELFNFIVSRDDLENEDVLSAPDGISWTRVSQYYPDADGDRPGHLIYHVRGYKVLEAFRTPGLLNWTQLWLANDFYAVQNSSLSPTSPMRPAGGCSRGPRLGAYSAECR